MSKLKRRLKKLNSESENFFRYSDDEAPTIGAVPYSSLYDYSKNGIQHILDTLYLSDNNYFSKRPYELDDIKEMYKI